jgi:uncharacterized protein (UPF0303 family)
LVIRSLSGGAVESRCGRNGEVIGSIAVSGLPSQEDIEMAELGA